MSFHPSIIIAHRQVWQPISIAFICSSSEVNCCSRVILANVYFVETQSVEGWRKILKKRSESNLDIMLLSMKKPNVCRDRLKTDLQQLKAKEILIMGHFIFPHFTRLQLVVLPSDWLIWLHASFVLGQTCFCCIQMTTLSVTQCSYAWNSERRRV